MNEFLVIAFHELAIYAVIFVTFVIAAKIHGDMQ